MTSPATAPLRICTVPTPFGPVALVVTPEDEVVRAAGFAPLDDLLARLSPALRLRGTTAGSPAAALAVAAYADGDPRALDDVAVEQPGGPFFQRAWAAMRAIPAGQTQTYAQLAAAAGSATAVRAAGSACARNLIVPFVPCHRVMRTGGTLGGYYYGLATKENLLGHERRALVNA